MADWVMCYRFVCEYILYELKFSNRRFVTSFCSPIPYTTICVILSSTRAVDWLVDRLDIVKTSIRHERCNLNIIHNVPCCRIHSKASLLSVRPFLVYKNILHLYGQVILIFCLKKHVQLCTVISIKSCFLPGRFITFRV